MPVLGELLSQSDKFIQFNKRLIVLDGAESLAVHMTENAFFLLLKLSEPFDY